MVCSYLNHAAVYRQGSANYVDVGCGGGALPLGEPAASGRARRGVVEGMRGGISVGRAVKGGRGPNITTEPLLFLYVSCHCFKMTCTNDI